jgi:ABC-2 type transport system permease protein
VSTWKAVFRHEMYRLTHHMVLTPMMLAAALAYVALFGGVYWNSLCRHTPIMVVDQDHSQLSRSFVRALKANEYFDVAMYGEQPDEIVPAIRRTQIAGAIVIPRKFESDTLAGRQGVVEVIADGTNILTGNVISRMAGATVSTFATTARALRLAAGGVPRTLAEAHAVPLRVVNRQLFNPTSNYIWFMLIAIAGIAVQQLARIAAAISLSLDAKTRERAGGDGQGCSAWTYLSAKLCGALVVGLPTALLAISLPALAFGMPFHGNWLVAYGMLTVFWALQVLIGYALAGVFKDTVLVTQVLIFLSVPSFTISGATWPAYAMPRALGWLSSIVPLTHLNDMTRRMALAGTSFGTLAPQFGAILIWIPPALLAARWAVRKTTGLR